MLDAAEQAAALRPAAARTEAAEAEVAELQRQMDLAMEAIGERSARVQELEEDIVDMKEIFHRQLEEAVGQLTAARAAAAAASDAKSVPAPAPALFR